MISALTFLIWTLCLYVIHRVIHAHGAQYMPMVFLAHAAHHGYINTHASPTWHCSNLLLYNDNWLSTVDLWFTEVIPTVIFAVVTGAWWILVFYYVWAAFIQECVEHSSDFNISPILTSGQWHLQHHRDVTSNYGLFLPIWDWVFGTYRGVVK
jgi:sterol desaturase/sphingolipid hydroxylase (fatty acid hydroxylase superfamily)